MEPDLSSGLRMAVAAPPAGAAARTPSPSRLRGAAGRLARVLGRVLAAAREADYRRAFYALAAVLVALFLWVAMHGPCLQLVDGHDAVGFLASAWRIHGGIYPHADYHTALGALNPWILAAGMWVLGPTGAVLPFCNALVAVALGLLAWTVAARRLPAVLAAAFALTQATVALTPHLLRFPWYAATYDGYYDRQCYALVGTLLLLVFLPPRREEDDRAARRDDRAVGAILGVLLFTKVSFCMAGVGLCVLGTLSGWRRKRLLPWDVAGAFGVVFVLCLPLIRFDLAAMFDDLRMAAAARPGNPAAVFTVGHYLGWLLDAWVESAVLAAMQALLHAPQFFRRERDDARRPAPSWLELAGVAGASAFVCMTNSPGGQHSETPLLTSWVFVLLGYALRPRTVDWRREAPAGPRGHVLPALGGLGGALWVFTFCNGLLCLVWSVLPQPTAWQQAALRRTEPFDSVSLGDLRVYATGGEPDTEGSYGGKVNDGLRLLRKLGGTHRVEALDFANPFPFALQWPATRGGLWCWHNGYSFSADAHPLPAEAFGGADVLMVPKYPGEQESYVVQSRLYGPYINTHFQSVGESAQWYLLRRK